MRHERSYYPTMTTIRQNHYVLAVPDADASARFYTRVLGFAEVGSVEGWRFVKRDSCMIMLGECPDAIAPSDLGDHSYFAYLVVDDVDAYWSEVRALGVEVMAELADKPWGMREFGIKTPDGHRLMIGQDVEQ